MKTNTKLDQIILGLAAIVISSAFMTSLFGDKDFDYVSGSPRYEAALGVVYFIVFLLFLRHFRQAMSVVKRSKPLILMVLLALVSAAWAENPGLAIRRSAALLGTTLVGVMLAARFTLEERLRLLSLVLRALAVVSLIYSVFIPSYGISNDLVHPGAWIGVFNSKNGLGAYIGVACIIDTYRPMKMRWRFFWFALYFLLLIKCGSATPLAGVVATWIVVAAFDWLRRKHHLSARAITIAIAGSIGCCAMAGLGSGLVQAIMGRSADLSGRTQLWQALIPVLFQRPLLGYGYGAFWAGGSEEYYSVASQITWQPMYAHNGFLEIIVSLGLVGFVLACLFLIQAAPFALRQADERQTIEGLFPLAFLIFEVIRNVTEVTILYHNNLEWAIFVATMLGAMSPYAERLQSTFARRSPAALATAKEYA